ncbi:valacyclovir hydrolase isoform X2 [Tribolium madens]|uniref:valacyclovir hydrolase isoform X2 n=1 Tax=Tribolium madens TaxID=41895 RepID=UPI001CF73FBB|nr:valacyclovir hydrolase isoform X2 [Tribolium madens]
MVASHFKVTKHAYLFHLITQLLSKMLLKTIKKKPLLKTVLNFSKTYSTTAQVTKVKGQTTNYVKTGQGNRNILCFPGALGTIWSDFKPQINDLANEKFTVIAWDPPGYGFSRPPERNFCQKFYENDADTAHDFMQHLGVKKFSLLGWSDGGISSMILAAKYPESVEKLVIWGANSYVIPEEIESYEKIRDVSKWSDKMKAPLVKLYTEAGLQKMWNDWCDAVTEMYVKNQGNICKEILGQIKCPTLILHGDKDPMVASEHPSYLESHIAGARSVPRDFKLAPDWPIFRLYRFPDGKHNIHLRYAPEFNKIVSEFLLN